MQAVEAPTGNATNGQFEEPPVINVTALLPPDALTGNGFQVLQMVPTNGAMGQYTIVLNNSVFTSGDAGAYQVESLDLLKIRLSELPAIAQLDQMSEAGVFAKSLAASAVRPVKDAAQMVTHPMDTVTGLPSGVGELFGRVSLGAQQVYSTATNSSESGGERAEQVSNETGNITKAALGYDQDRRDLARKLHVDPYTSDPILKERLNKIAWAMFAGRISVDAVEAVAVPGSMIISSVQFTDDLVYQTPKGDLILLVEKKLHNIGLSKADIAVFTHNTAIPLSLQVSAVRDLESLGPIPGRRSVANALANVMTEYQARFLVTSIKMLSQWGQTRSPIVRLTMQGVIVGTDQNGGTIVPAPVDFLSWTPRIAGFATDPAMLAMPKRVLWIPAPTTALAHQQLIANGWLVYQNPQP